MNAYAVVCPVSRRSVLIDPGAEPERLNQMLAGSIPTAIIVTHGHSDHTGDLETMRRILKVPVLAHPAGGLDPDQPVYEGDRIPVGQYGLRVLHAPGHSEDAVCLAFESDRRIVVGDVIFEGGPGKTWSAAAFRQTLVTLRRLVADWPDETICYPGHGSSFSIGERRPAIDAFLKREHGDFFGDAIWEM